MERREFIRRTAGLAAAGALSPLLMGGSRRPNVLFLMTDQQQGAAMSCAGNGIISTPNLDRLARSGARFSNAYSACPICVPARTTILTGQSLCATGISQNGQLKRALTGKEGVLKQKTYHEVLAENGYTAEYWGKWHSVEERTKCFANRDRMDDGKEAYDAFLSEHGQTIPKPMPGEVIDKQTLGPYTPDPLDARSGRTPRTGSDVEAQADAYVGSKSRRESRKSSKGKGDEDENSGGAYGRLAMPSEYSRTAFIGSRVLEAITRLKDTPFSIAGSFGPPHPPMVVSSPYYGMYPAKDMPLPASFRDNMENSPYAERAKAMTQYQDAKTIGYMISNYYGLIKEVDDWIGRILDTLDRTGLRDNTLIVFTSDHGEMLGAHGMYSKMVFYDEAARVPLLMSFPGKIPANTVIDDPVGHIDIFATILDCLGSAAPASQGASLLPLMMRDPAAARGYCVSEWPHRNSPNYLVRTKRYKFLFANSKSSTALNALYDMRSDPYEMNNLIGSNPERSRYKEEAETMKQYLMEWLTRVGSPDAAGVRERPVI